MVADIFMCSIESITSVKKKVTISKEDGGTEEVEVPIWNGTLANIILMSLGPRSAPEVKTLCESTKNLATIWQNYPRFCM